MQKFFPKDKLLSFPPEKQLKILYDLATLLEFDTREKFKAHLDKLKNYHDFLASSSNEHIQKLNKEFEKVKANDYQFQIYLMNLERLLGQSKKDYQMMVKQKDSSKTTKSLPITCVLDSIRSAHNIGAIFRNSDCFHIHKIILTGLSPTPENPQVQKTAMGTETLTIWEYQKSAIKAVKELKEKGFQIWSIETGNQSEPLNSIQDCPEAVALIFGHEVYGISLELLQLSDKVIHIPLRGSKNSLNVSISHGIVLNHLSSIMS